jgi:hypothetical protein
MIGVILAVLLAALVYWLCVTLGLPAIVGIVAAILVLLAGVRRRAVGDLLAHRQVARRAPHRRVGDDPVDDLLQVARDPGDDPAQQVARTRDAVHLQHLGHAPQVRHRLVEPPLGDLEEHEGEDGEPDRGRVDGRAGAREHAPLLEPREARRDGVARDAEAPRRLRDAHPRVLREQAEQAAVELVDRRAGHVAQLAMWTGG